MAIGYNRYLNDFDMFTDSNSNLSNYKYIKYSCLEYCSFVLYVVFDYAYSKPLIFSDYKLIKKYIDNDQLVYAINYLDYYILEVVNN